MAKKKGKAKKAAKKGKSKSKEMLIVSSKARAFAKSKKCMVSSEFLPALNEVVYEAIERAAERCKANRRSTLRAQDL